MSNIERAFLISTEPGTESASVDESTRPVGADAIAQSGCLCKRMQTEPVGNGPQDPPLTQAKRLEMVAHAQALADYYEAEYRLFWTLWTREGGGCFDHIAAYDLALANFHKVCELRDSLKKGIKQ